MESSLVEFLFSGFIVNKNIGELKMYKSIDVEFNLNYDGHSWMTTDLENAKNYGKKHVVCVKNNKKLRLININSWSFSHHFMDMLNKRYGNSLEEIIIKLQIAFPLGLPDKDIQEKLLRDINVDHYQKLIPDMKLDSGKENEKYKLQVLRSCLFPGSRCSYTSLDEKLVLFLKETYGEYFDGYIQENKMHVLLGNFPNSFEFPSEICLFNIKNCDLTTNNLGGKSKTHKGGTNVNFNDRLVPQENVRSLDLKRMFPAHLLESQTLIVRHD